MKTNYTYSEFKNVYKWIIAKYPRIDGLYSAEGEIETTTTYYTKSGSTWKKTATADGRHSYAEYINILDFIPFMRKMGGYERITCSYTKRGFLPVELISINPERTQKTVRRFYFI